MTTGQPFATWAGQAVQAAGVTLLPYFEWRSLRWPLIHDIALMHYKARLISAGAVPYRDTFDMNMPGVYLNHMALVAVGGAGDIAFRVFDLGWLAATAGLMFLYCRPAGNRVSGVTAGLFFAIYHVSGGATLAGQRDFLLCIFLPRRRSLGGGRRVIAVPTLAFAPVTRAMPGVRLGPAGAAACRPPASRGERAERTASSCSTRRPGTSAWRWKGENANGQARVPPGHVHSRAFESNPATSGNGRRPSRRGRSGRPRCRRAGA